MVNAIIIDDEPLARMMVKEYLQPYSNIHILQECADGFEGLKAIQHHQPDLLFLDIQMPKINGFEMLELLENVPAVIFTTAFDEYAIKAFEAHAIDYLLKPFSKERFDKAIKKYLDHFHIENKHSIVPSLLEMEMPIQSERVVVKIGGKIKIIPIAEIQYLEAADDYVKIFTSEGSYLKNKTMAFFEKAFPVQKFVRIHRSYLLNVQEITRIDILEKDNHLAVLRSGVQLPVSKNGYVRLRSMLGV